jgi:hypothetical protein
MIVSLRGVRARAGHTPAALKTLRLHLKTTARAGY